jgi:hypothetical protein
LVVSLSPSHTPPSCEAALLGTADLACLSDPTPGSSRVTDTRLLSRDATSIKPTPATGGCTAATCRYHVMLQLEGGDALTTRCGSVDDLLRVMQAVQLTDRLEVRR